MLIETLRELSPKTIRTILCDDPTAFLSDLEVSDLTTIGDINVAVCSLEKLPRLDLLIDKMILSLSEISLAIFPCWHNRNIDQADTSGNIIGGTIANRHAIEGIVAEIPKVSAGWVQGAVKSCIQGRTPVLKQFNREVNAAQLSLSISPDNLVMLLCIADTNPSSQHLLGLAKATEWFVRVTGSAVCLLIPEPLRKFKALETILYDSVVFESDKKNHIPDPRIDEKKHLYHPVKGCPHPLSPGEKVLARQLSFDTELSGLFGYNESVTTVRDSRFMVDLVWPEGKVVVEVDGFGIHSNRHAFSRDRNRDYELLISGYLVLRLAHDDVMRDVEIAVDKIRDVVNYRKTNPIITNEEKI